MDAPRARRLSSLRAACTAACAALLVSALAAAPAAAEPPATGPGGPQASGRACGFSDSWASVSRRPDLLQRLTAAGVDERAWLGLDARRRDELCRDEALARELTRERQPRDGEPPADAPQTVSDIRRSVAQVAGGPQLRPLQSDAAAFGRVVENSRVRNGDVGEPAGTLAGGSLAGGSLAGGSLAGGSLAGGLRPDAPAWRPAAQRPAGLATDLAASPPPGPATDAPADQPGWFARQWNRVSRFATGFGNAFSSDMTLGATPRIESDSRALRAGQLVGDLTAQALGTSQELIVRGTPVVAGVVTTGLAFSTCKVATLPADVTVIAAPATAAGCAVGASALGVGAHTMLSQSLKGQEGRGQAVANEAANNVERYWKKGAYHGPKPQYEVNPEHVPGPGYKPGKTPLPTDAAQRFRTAIPSDEGRLWWSYDARTDTWYRYTRGHNGLAHFTGSSANPRGLNVPPDVVRRFDSYLRDMRLAAPTN